MDFFWVRSGFWAISTREYLDSHAYVLTNVINIDLILKDGNNLQANIADAADYHIRGVIL